MDENLTPDEIELIESVLRMHEVGGDVTVWEDEFLSDLAERYEEYGARTRLSARQMEVIEKIVEKYL